MDAMSHRVALRVAAQHIGKQAVELAGSIAAFSLNSSGVEAIGARCNIAAIRRELADLEHLLEGREPPIPAAPASERGAYEVEPASSLPNHVKEIGQ